MASNKRAKSIGAALALAAAAAFAVIPASVMAADSDTVHCGGVNACKGQSDCKTAGSSCKGLNGCKGKGFKDLSASECTTAGGKPIKG